MVSVFDLFSVGIGPSSSHTVGPMRAANRFAHLLEERGVLDRVVGVHVELYGSLGATGPGHGTPDAVVARTGGAPSGDRRPRVRRARVAGIRDDGKALLAGRHPVALDHDDVVLLHRVVDPRHTNALRFTATDADGAVLAEKTYYSIGGGFVLARGRAGDAAAAPVPHPFETAEDLLERCATTGAAIAELVLANETVTRDEAEVRARLAEIWRVMRECIDAGVPHRRHAARRPAGATPGRDAVPAADRARRPRRPGAAMDWLNLARLAVNEENASGGRIVTAPTNGAAGHRARGAALRPALPARPALRDEAAVEYLLTAAAIGILFKRPRLHLGRRGAGARARSGRPAPWRPPGSPRCSAAPRPRSRTPPRSPWSTTSG